MADNTSMYVVLDANILIRDFWMNGPSFTYLLTHRFLGHRPVIPEIAYLEARNHLKIRAEMLLSKRAIKSEGSHGNMLKLSRLFNYKKISSNAKWDVESLLKRWDKHIAKTLRSSDGKILPSPQVDTMEIIQRSIGRRKPFSNGDRGFRDTIIWLSTLALIGPESRVSFITGNTQDFFQPGSAYPHPEILEEAERKLDPSWKMLFHRSLDEFISEFDSDRSTSSEALQHALVSNTLPGFNLWEWLEENLVDVLNEEDYDGINWAGFPYHAEGPILVDVEDLVSVDIPRTSHLVNDTYRLYCDIAFIGHFTCTVGFAKAEIVVNPNQIIWKDESDSYWTKVGIRVAATFVLRIDFDVRARNVVSCFARPLVHWSSYDDIIDKLDSDYKLLHEDIS